jgi:hypothetical protein
MITLAYTIGNAKAVLAVAKLHGSNSIAETTATSPSLTQVSLAMNRKIYADACKHQEEACRKCDTISYQCVPTSSELLSWTSQKATGWPPLTSLMHILDKRAANLASASFASCQHGFEARGKDVGQALSQ